MIQLRWIVSVLLMPFLWGRSVPLVRPTRIDWMGAQCSAGTADSDRLEPFFFSAYYSN